MRTMIDIDPQSHRLAKAIASQKGISLGKFISEAIQAFCGRAEPMNVKLGRSRSGFPTIDTGRPITPTEVADALDDTEEFSS